MKTAQEITTILKGKLWEKGNYSRVYFDLSSFCKAAEVEGRTNFARCHAANTFFDLKENKIVGIPGLSYSYEKMLKEHIENLIF